MVAPLRINFTTISGTQCGSGQRRFCVNKHTCWKWHEGEKVGDPIPTLKESPHIQKTYPRRNLKGSGHREQSGRKKINRTSPRLKHLSMSPRKEWSSNKKRSEHGNNGEAMLEVYKALAKEKVGSKMDEGDSNDDREENEEDNPPPKKKVVSFEDEQPLNNNENKDSCSNNSSNNSSNSNNKNYDNENNHNKNNSNNNNINNNNNNNNNNKNNANNNNIDNNNNKNNNGKDGRNGSNANNNSNNNSNANGKTNGDNNDKDNDDNNNKADKTECIVSCEMNCDLKNNRISGGLGDTISLRYTITSREFIILQVQFKGELLITYLSTNQLQPNPKSPSNFNFERTNPQPDGRGGYVFSFRIQMGRDMQGVQLTNTLTLNTGNTYSPYFLFIQSQFPLTVFSRTPYIDPACFTFSF